MFFHGRNWLVLVKFDTLAGRFVAEQWIEVVWLELGVLSCWWLSVFVAAVVWSVGCYRSGCFGVLAGDGKHPVGRDDRRSLVWRRLVDSTRCKKVRFWS